MRPSGAISSQRRIDPRARIARFAKGDSHASTARLASSPSRPAALRRRRSLAADTYTIDKNHSDVSFQIRHFASKVRGRFADFERNDPGRPGQAGGLVGRFTIKAASIDTNNADRDKHLRSADFFDAEKFPEITFKSTQDHVRPGRTSTTSTGTLTMHGVSKEVTLPVDVPRLA